MSDFQENAAETTPNAQAEVTPPSTAEQSALTDGELQEAAGGVTTDTSLAHDIGEGIGYAAHKVVEGVEWVWNAI